MISAVRRAIAGVLLGTVLSLGVGVTAQAVTPSPTPTATSTSSVKKTATATPTAVDSGESNSTDTPDVAPDNSRTILAITAAAVLALLAAGMVFLKRR